VLKAGAFDARALWFAQRNIDILLNNKRKTHTLKVFFFFLKLYLRFTASFLVSPGTSDPFANVEFEPGYKASECVENRI
jgi:hypothetical protein